MSQAPLIIHIKAALHSTCSQPAVTDVTTHGLPLVSVFCKKLCRKAELGGPHHGRTLWGACMLPMGWYVPALLAKCLWQCITVVLTLGFQVLGKQPQKHPIPFPRHLNTEPGGPASLEPIHGASSAVSGLRGR